MSSQQDFLTIFVQNHEIAHLLVLIFMWGSFSGFLKMIKFLNKIFSVFWWVELSSVKNEIYYTVFHEKQFENFLGLDNKCWDVS